MDDTVMILGIQEDLLPSQKLLACTRQRWLMIKRGS